MEVDRAARLANQARLRALIRRPEARLRLFCAHDPTEFAMFAAASAHASRPIRRPPPEWISALETRGDGRPDPDALVDAALADTFPASDPAAYQSGRTRL
jgi:hypothetical protein